MDPHLTIVAMELARQRLTTDRTLLMFSALPDAPIRDVTPPSRLRRLMIATRRRYSTARRQAGSTHRDTCPHPTISSTWDETTPSKAHC